MSGASNGPLNDACELLRKALGSWWQDERSKWCAYCGIAMKLRCPIGVPVPPQKRTRDHVIPKKHRGGKLTIPACYSCNLAKGSMSLPEFLLSEYFQEKRKLKHRHKWPVAHLWLATALAATVIAQGEAVKSASGQTNIGGTPAQG